MILAVFVSVIAIAAGAPSSTTVVCDPTLVGVPTGRTFIRAGALELAPRVFAALLLLQAGRRDRTRSGARTRRRRRSRSGVRGARDRARARRPLGVELDDQEHVEIARDVTLVHLSLPPEYRACR